MIFQVNSYFCKEKAVSVLFPNFCFRFFLLQFIVFSIGRGVCLPAGWIQWHGLMTVSTEEGGVQPISASL